MPRRPSQHRLRVLAVQVCQAVVELTRQRTGRGEQWVMLKSVQDRLGTPEDELQAAVAFAASRRALSNYVDHFHAERNHQGKGNVLLFPRAIDRQREGPVQCRERLSGLLRYYHREAA